MNRPIKFRVWTGAVMEYKILAGALGHFYVAGMSEKDTACLSDFNTIYNEAAPLMQWTGLLDKNGKEIYEGDILKPSQFRKLKGYEVKIGKFETDGYSGGSIEHYGVFLGSESCPEFISNFKSVEVIGNIHANPELLK